MVLPYHILNCTEIEDAWRNLLSPHPSWHRGSYKPLPFHYPACTAVLTTQVLRILGIGVLRKSIRIFPGNLVIQAREEKGRKEGEGVTCSLTEFSMSPPQTLPLAMWNLTGSPKTDSPKTCHHASSHPMEVIDAVVPNLF